MKLIKDHLDYTQKFPKNHIPMFTANRVVKTNGNLVMGGGNALACNEAFPLASSMFGEYFLLNKVAYPHITDTHIAFINYPIGNIRLGAFITKGHYKEDSSLPQVLEALEMFASIAEMTPQNTYHLPFPAIGLGGLKKEQLLPHVEQLPDNVYVYL